MTEKKRKFFSGPSLEAALVAAASEYGIPVDQVAYKKIEKKHGFLKVRRNVVIQVDPESPQRADDAPPAVEPEPAGRRTPPPPPRQRDEPDEDEEPADVAAESTEEPEAPEEPEEAAQAEEAEEAEEPAPVEPPGGRRRRRAAQPEEPEPEEEDEDEDDEEVEDQEEPEELDEDEDDQDEDDEDEDEDDEDDRDEDRGGRRRGRRRQRRRRAPRPVEPKPIPPIEQRLKKAKGKMADGVLESTDWLLDLLDLDVDAEVYKGDDRYEVELRGRDRERLIDEEGKVLSALEHLIPRVMHGVLGETSAIRVDSENFQEGREERLRQTAMQTAFEVRESGKAEVLEPMDPADRRIVHLAVNDEAGVNTKSLGGGFFKRVKIYPD